MIAESLEPTVRISSARSLFVFLALAFALMWICFFTVAFVPILAGSPLGGALILLGAFAPALAALAVTFRAEGRSGVIALFRRITRWNVAARYYVFAIGFMIALKLTAAMICRASTSAWPRFDTSQWYLIPFAIAFSTPFQAGEEIGWRGYALPGLADRFGLRSASVLVGFIWGVWHLPQFFIRDGDSYRQAFPVFVLQVTAMSVAFAWLYARTNGSVLLTMLLHAAINNSKDIVPSGVLGGTDTFGFHASRISWISLALLCASAAYFLNDMRKQTLGSTTNAIST
jgi:membrane protease YdiL (CAAX protease family)